VLTDQVGQTAAKKKAFLLTDPRLKNLPAVANQRFVTTPSEAATWPGVRTAPAIEALAFRWCARYGFGTP
jgi:ABC-type Fe3+-hydroxamate transport system substrate-binding protein